MVNENEILRKRENEDYYSYTWRIDKAIRNGLLDNWTTVTPIVNKELYGEDFAQYKSESAYRKDVASARRFFEAGVFDDAVLAKIGLENIKAKYNRADESCASKTDVKAADTETNNTKFDTETKEPEQYDIKADADDDDVDAELLNAIQKEKDELYKLKRQLSDQRREYNKLLVADGRGNNLLDRIKQCIEEVEPYKPRTFIARNSDVVVNDGGRGKSDRVGVLVWTDWHYGMVANNVWNVYNTSICEERVMRTVAKTIEYIRLFGLKKLYIISLGDAIHGAIHVSCRVASEENTCDQLIKVSELMANAMDILSDHVDEIEFYSCYGNHARTLQKLNESMHEDNMEKIIPWWIKQRFKGNNKIHVIDSDYHEFTVFNVLGYNICAVHGDLDNIKNVGVKVNTLFTKKYNKKIDYVICGDKHHLEEFEQFGIESIIVRSLCGTDEYANNKRLYSSAGQTLLIFSAVEGRECTRNIKFE